MSGTEILLISSSIGNVALMFVIVAMWTEHRVQRDANRILGTKLERAEKSVDELMSSLDTIARLANDDTHRKHS